MMSEVDWPKAAELPDGQHGGADGQFPRLVRDYAVGEETGYRCGRHAVELGVELADALQKQVLLGRGTRAVLLAAFATLLHRHTRQDRLRIPVAVLNEMPGMAAWQEIPVCFDSAQTVQQLIEAVSETLLNTPRRPPASVIAAPVVLSFGDLTDEAALQSGPDLHLILARGTTTFSGLLTYNAEMFRPETIASLARQLCVLIQAMLRRLDANPAALPLLEPMEAQMVRTRFTGASVEYPLTRLHRYIEAHARTQPEAIAVSFGNVHLSYAALNQRANQLAHHMLNAGVCAGDRVAVCVRPSPHIVVCLLAILKAGAAYVPLDPAYPADRLAVIIEDTRPAMLLSEAGASDNLMPCAIPWLDLDAQALDHCSTDDCEPDAPLDSAAFIIYTSGTTGRPKGVMLSHGNLIHYLLVAQKRYGFDRFDVMPALARFGFSISLFELLSPLLAGGRVLILAREDVLDFRRLAATLQQATVVHASPSLLRRLLAYLTQSAIDPRSFRRLRHVSSGGDMVTADLIEALKKAFEEAEIFVIYGCSEIACMGCTYAVPRGRKVARNLVGGPFENVAVRLYDEWRNPVPIGLPGEIHFSGPGVGLGYLDRPELTDEKFVVIDGKRFYRTGDLGRFDADGNLEMLGRTDFQIKLRGMRIEPAEVESVLRQLSGIHECAVAARQLPNGETGLVAYVVMADPAVRDAIRDFLKSKLPDYMLPAAIVVLDAMPLNVNQKLDRRSLPAPGAHDFGHSTGRRPPRNEMEGKLAAIWEAILQISPLGIDDDFFAIGGDSLASIDLMMEIEKVFGRALPLSALLTAPTIEGLAALLRPNAVARNSLVLLKAGGKRPPIFFIHDGDGEILPYRNLAFHLHAEHPVYGILPHHRDRHPMLHTRIADMVDYYAEQILKVAPEGPYLLGGLCIGGFLAFEVARRFRRRGQSVRLVALLDAAHVNTPLASIAAQRSRRFRADVRDAWQQSWRKALATVSSKIIHVASYEARTRSRRTMDGLRIRWLRHCLDRGTRLPAVLRDIPVDKVLRFAEKEYDDRTSYEGHLLLLRATAKDPRFDGTPVDDTPYVELFREPSLGWEGRSAALEVHDIPGGHSSMLQEPNVRHLAAIIQAHIDAAR